MSFLGDLLSLCDWSGQGVYISLVLGVSIVLQIVAVVLAIRLLRLAGAAPAWLAVVAALVLMVGRRAVTQSKPPMLVLIIR